MNFKLLKHDCQILSACFDLRFKRLKRNHFDRKFNYLWIFLQKILSEAELPSMDFPCALKT